MSELAPHTLAPVSQPGPPGDLDALYQRMFRRLRGVARAILLDDTQAEDAVHDAFEGLARRAAVPDNPEAYLHRTVVNQCLKVIRRRGVVRRHPPDRLVPTGDPDVDDTWRHVARLPVRQRAVVVLRFWDDQSLDQIATTLDMPLGTVKSTLHRALHTLKHQL